MTEAEQNAIREIQHVTGLAGGAYAVIEGGSTRTECFGYADTVSYTHLTLPTIA